MTIDDHLCQVPRGLHQVCAGWRKCRQRTPSNNSCHSLHISEGCGYVLSLVLCKCCNIDKWEGYAHFGRYVLGQVGNLVVYILQECQRGPAPHFHDHGIIISMELERHGAARPEGVRSN